MKRGTCDTGTEMSCLRLAPSLRCASGMDSRSRQNASRSRSFCATAASVTHPSPSACFERVLQDASSGSPAREEDSSHSTYHGDGGDSGSITPGM